MFMPSVSLPAVRAPGLWKAAQYAGLALTVLLLAALFVQPERALHVLWEMVIPLLPAVFLVNPLIWRNVCPLATLNSLTGKRTVGRRMRPTLARGAWAVGILLLVSMVPARRILFNEHGAPLAATIVGVGALALVAGMTVSRRGGFCNALCPVLPVEKLYGQSPLVQIGTARCATCTLCTASGCIELAQRKTVAQTLGPMRRTSLWILTAFGAFAAAFPGFIWGYFLTQNGPASSTLQVYAIVALFAAASYLFVLALTMLFRLPSTVMLPVLGAVSFAAYYWHAAPRLAAAYGAPAVAGTIVQLMLGIVVGFWLYRALRPQPQRALWRPVDF